MSERLTHRDLGKALGVSETTIKSYRRKFPTFIPVAGYGKPIRFKAEALAVCRRIQDLFREGLPVGQVEKALKAEFKEYPDQKPEPEPPFTGGLSEQSFKDFFKAAGQMMQGMAALATAQAKADQRLARLEEALHELVLGEAENQSSLNELLGELRSQSARRPAAADAGAAEVRARRIVSVRASDGHVDSYSLEPEPEPAEAPAEPAPDQPERPASRLLELPVAIQNDQGEFLGVPGRLPLGQFVELLKGRYGHLGAMRAFWMARGPAWVFSIDAEGGQHQELYFVEATTPKGARVALLSRLDLDGREVKSMFLQEYFRQIKNWLD